MRVSLQYAPRHPDAEDELTGIVLTLSRRNLASLLHMLDEGRTAGALTGRDENVEILVQAQEDDVHYADRDAGAMSWERGEAPDVMLVIRESQADHIELDLEQDGIVHEATDKQFVVECDTEELF